MDSLHLKHLPRVVNIVFNKADVNISDFHHFHDARFSHMCLNHELDVRVSHIPSVHGSALVLRLLDKGKMALGLMELGYSPLHWDIIEANLIRPDGVSLIVGPTGCGKTTSLYAMLNVIKSISKKIVTIEDPVEVKLPLTTQLQINEQRGVMFSESVRAFLRHDPDIMLIGEIRDGETAKEAMRASLTGHKVFATLHATRANEALLRLNDLGIETHYIANCVTMVMAQRLVRKLCQHCKFSLRVDKKDLKNYEKKYLSQDSQVIFKERGCQECVQGFSGRSIVAEVLSLDGGVRSLLFKEGFQVIPQISFEGDAQRLIRDGITSLSEIVRVLG